VALTFTPNGSIVTANDNVNGNWNYRYDEFNRLTCSNLASNGTCAAPTNGTPSYTYDYDRFGNRWHQNGSGTMLLSFSGANNRMDGYSYDAAGNLLNDGAGHSFTYDAENRLIAVGNNLSYVYDGNGRRIRKTVSGVSADYLYDVGDHVVAEMSSSGGWNRGEVFAKGRHVATYNNSTTYFTHADWLGTERVRTALNGSTYESCTSLPFGDWLTCSGGDPSPLHFTGKERDSESGLDNLGARYNSSNMGRFMTPDLMGGHQEDPQTLKQIRLRSQQSFESYRPYRPRPVSQGMWR